MANNDKIDLEEKVDLLLALAVDERLWPNGALSEDREMLAGLGIELGQSDRVQHILRLLSRLEDRYFLSRSWVGQRLNEVISRLNNLEGELQNLTKSARINTETLSASADRLRNVDRALDEIRADAGSSLRQTRELSEAITKIATQYSSLQTSSADINAAVSSLTTQFKETKASLEKIEADIREIKDRR